MSKLLKYILSSLLLIGCTACDDSLTPLRKLYEHKSAYKFHPKDGYISRFVKAGEIVESPYFTIRAPEKAWSYYLAYSLNAGIFSLTIPNHKDVTFLLTDEELDTIQNMTLDIEIYQDFFAYYTVKGKTDFKDIDEFVTAWMNDFSEVACDPNEDCQKWREHMPFSYPGHKSRAVKIEYWGEINSGDVAIGEELRKEMVASLGDKYKGDDVLEYDRILRENLMQNIEAIRPLTNVTDYYFIEYQQNNRRKYLVMKCFYKIQGVVGEDPAFKKKWDDRHKKCEETAQSIKFRNLDIQKK